jgi:hypothetical protein
MHCGEMYMPPPFFFGEIQLMQRFNQTVQRIVFEQPLSATHSKVKSVQKLLEVSLINIEHISYSQIIYRFQKIFIATFFRFCRELVNHIQNLQFSQITCLKTRLTTTSLLLCHQHQITSLKKWCLACRHLHFTGSIKVVLIQYSIEI